MKPFEVIQQAEQIKLAVQANDVEKIHILSKPYIAALNSSLPAIFKEVRETSDHHVLAELLTTIFKMQEALMGMRIVGKMELSDELREVADEFDNNDPNVYEYLLTKIKAKSFTIQLT